MFDWLKDYQKLEEDIAYLEYNLDKTKAELKRWVYGDLRYVSLTRDSQGAKVEECMEAIEYELAHKMNDVFDLKKLIRKFEGLDHQILKLKYMDGLTLACIASELNYNPDYIRRRHAEVMRIVKFVDAL
ncbi:hypothetical protein ACWKTS_33645 [Bacillus toyonensis]|uniref:hypothetical protein n=1 Tax=Bacillus cereus group TaxID=86661 RepID=UPI000BF0A6B9|nr:MULTISPECIES: hypothetical protein [Bacillus cereus group]PEK00301.1 hypothetical protein CN688_00095 [Bacillus toyonensis]PEO41793.1 hypothetical protein CN579_34160 [Bacillus toyonensis]PFP82704.1 hypothetical protein COK02_30360 [Bacillus cereus]PGA83503.1 hypothetical protein COL90_05020 [Bacillus toyonensis]PGP74604.1 hypothetical protein COA00_00145 [Bacillus cereus]